LACDLPSKHQHSALISSDDKGDESLKSKKRITPHEYGPKAKTPMGRSVFRDLFPTEDAAELEIRSTLLRGLEHWLANASMTQAKAGEVLCISQASVSDIKRGKINQFSLTC
jgi:predicted XRE-type DNA-binding protein